AILSEAGYDTRGFVSHIMLSPKHGFAKGFDVYDDSVLDVGHPHKVSTAELLTDKVLANLPSGETPFFLWVHYFDPHFDYLPHEPWSNWDSTDLHRYDGEIAFTDRQIGRLLDGLGNAGLMERTLTVVTADHGEAFGERGARHHFSTFEEVVRVPLILHGPTIASHASTRPAQQIDLLPTILGLFRLEPPRDLPGHDLLTDDSAPTDVFIERYRPSPFIQRALIRGGEKLITVEVTPDAQEAPERIENAYKRTKIRPGVFLYDLNADPGETTNLFSADDPEAVELLTELERYSAGSAKGVGDLEIDEETRNRLEALGYLN
ncbi:MAG: sulfatase, partial [Acidobacteriota bacterium]